MTETALIFDIKRNCSEDGPGIRTTVFFKGCPLRCAWCHNPEGISSAPSLAFRGAVCHPDTCGAPCIRVCPTGALRLASPLAVDRAECTRCDLCFGVCRSHALEPVGYRIPVDQLLYRVLIDKPFFLSTQGGVTLSGGEPTLQMTFISRFLAGLKQEGVSTAIETCGYFDFERFRELALPYLDLIYFDLKLFDDEQCRRHTGQLAGPVLRNLARLLEVASIPVIPRIPLIPGITDTAENLSALGRFLRRHAVAQCSLMRYNPLWRDKLETLGLAAAYGYGGFPPRSSEDACVRYFHAASEGGTLRANL
ncbi:MAG: glycyl-radical enzyme activating protein [Bryobacterales bacterium]|nr:glycyl-radical enzyme activating protein [Bryobacterales bacterium]